MSGRALIFDCDGVLVDSEAISMVIELDHLSRIGLDYAREDYCTRFMGMVDAEFLAALERDCADRGLTPLPDDFMERLKAAKWARMETELTALDGAAAFLKRHSGPRAVASSSGVEPLHRKLRATGLHGHFDPHIYSGAQVENGKPAPDLFLLTADRLGVHPEACVVIEDSVNGVRAGCAAGMTVWGYTGGGHADPGLTERLRGAGAHRVFASHDEIGAAWFTAGDA